MSCEYVLNIVDMKYIATMSSTLQILWGFLKPKYVVFKYITFSFPLKWLKQNAG